MLDARTGLDEVSIPPRRIFPDLAQHPSGTIARIDGQRQRREQADRAPTSACKIEQKNRSMTSGRWKQ
ncbi:hypothetical protein WMF45_37050 [Sorangium sp. So ce448]|uniref:hypothetical protein n=1 Tax=Sorangium sp. So ce448 TaxID=3133314 RepID=UPI003F604580